MKKITCVAGLALALALSGGSAAEAISLTPSSAALIATTNFNDTINTAEEWFTYLGIAPEPTLLYKSNVGGVDESTYKNSYDTAFSNTATDPADALITYVAGKPVIACGTCYLLVKDGNQTPAQYLFSLTGWNGTESISLTGFWPNQGAISNVAIYSGAPTSVPEPATASLLALGLVCLVARRRRADSAE